MQRTRVFRARVRQVILVLALAGYGLSAAAQEVVPMSPDCPAIMKHGYGPFDYRVADQEKKNLVEGAHFLPMVENLIKGHRGYLGGDIDYTLRAFPNHPRALMSMMRLAEKVKADPPQGANARVHCYFEHAINFRSDDGGVRMVYGLYLLRKDKLDEAAKQLELAATLNEGDPNVYYNLGLAYVKLKKYDLALQNAHKAYAGGFPLPGLRDLLKRAGQWKEAPPIPAADSEAPAGSSEPLASAPK